ncbi:MAG: methyltransferase domain-containing protein [Chitinophagaceae bacterium]
MNKHQHTIDIYNQHVQNYVNKFMDLGLYKDTFDYLLENIPADGNILELGCGPGNVVKHLKSKRSDLQITGIDLAPEMIKEAKEQNPESKFEVMDICDSGQILEQFNAVIAAFCLPYISYDDIDDLFKNIRYLTMENGLLYVSCMEGPKQRSGFEKTSFTGDNEMYINYYEREEIELLLKKNNFTVEAFYTKDYPEEDGSVTIDLMYIARKYSV